MHFRFFDDLMGSAPEASPEFRFETGRNIQKKLLIKLLKKCLENLHKICTKILKFPKICFKFLVKFKNNLRKF